MPTRATMTIWSLYNYDDTLFDFMPIPTEGIDKDLMINSILVNCATLELVYPDHKLMKEMLLPMWANKNRYKWKTLFETTQFEYNPIYNVDATEVETVTLDTTKKDDNTRTLDTTQKDDNTRTLNTTQKDDNTRTLDTTQKDDNTRTLDTTQKDDNTRTLNTQNDQDLTGKYAGFNSSTMKNVSENTGYDSKQTGTIKDEREIKDSGTITDEREIIDSGTIKDAREIKDSGTITDGREIKDSGTIKDGREIKDSGTVTTEKLRHGNIGVTMTQQMIQAEREVAQFSIYDVIANDFKMEFCVMVY